MEDPPPPPPPAPGEACGGQGQQHWAAGQQWQAAHGGGWYNDWQHSGGAQGQVHSADGGPAVLPQAVPDQAELFRHALGHGSAGGAAGGGRKRKKGRGGQSSEEASLAAAAAAAKAAKRAETAAALAAVSALPASAVGLEYLAPYPEVQQLMERVR